MLKPLFIKVKFSLLVKVYVLNFTLETMLCEGRRFNKSEISHLGFKKHSVLHWVWSLYIGKQKFFYWFAKRKGLSYFTTCYLYNTLPSLSGSISPPSFPASLFLMSLKKHISAPSEFLTNINTRGRYVGKSLWQWKPFILIIGNSMCDSSRSLHTR